MEYISYAEALRFWSMVNIGLAEQCWEYTGYINQDGYGKFAVRRNGQQKNLAAHKVAFFCLRGQIGEGLCVRHRCDYRRCCNPSHLEPGTHRENMADMAARGRAYRAIGELAARSKLTAQDILVIRARKNNGESTASLARAFGVCHSSIKGVVSGKSWGHVTAGPSVTVPLQDAPQVLEAAE